MLKLKQPTISFANQCLWPQYRILSQGLGYTQQDIFSKCGHMLCLPFHYNKQGYSFQSLYPCLFSYFTALIRAPVLFFRYIYCFVESIKSESNCFYHYYRFDTSNHNDKIEILKFKRFPKVAQFYTFFRVKNIPPIAPVRIIGANLTNSHSNA